jgi:hypothetical protein
VRIRLCLADGDKDLYAIGTIVWLHEKHDSGTMLSGVRFDPLSEFDKERLLDFCSDRGGEQNLLWSLWDTMVHVDNAT